VNLAIRRGGWNGAIWRRILQTHEWSMYLERGNIVMRVESQPINSQESGRSCCAARAARSTSTILRSGLLTRVAIDDAASEGVYRYKFPGCVSAPVCRLRSTACLP
jgi:hypothetical protein